MGLFSLSDILADAAALSNSPAFGASTRITSTRATYWATQAAQALHALLVQKFPDDRDLAQVLTGTTTANVRTMAIPTGSSGQQPEGILAVIWHRGASDYVLLESAELEDLAYREDVGWDQVVPSYSLLGTSIEFSPAPKTVETVSVYAYYETVSDTIGAGNIYGRTDHDRWITLDVARRVMRARRMDDSALLRDQQLLERDMFARARSRDRSRHKTVRDVRCYDSRARWWER
jgi:hypothetical protein